MASPVLIQLLPHHAEEPDVEYIGEISEAEKSEFLGNAVGLLFPIVWREPFGLAMIEAMACGTPVVARRNGSVPEVVDEGVTGFIFASDAEAAMAARRLHQLDRSRVRRVFEERFTAQRMAEDYVFLYRRVMAEREREHDNLITRERSDALVA